MDRKAVRRLEFSTEEDPVEFWPLVSVIIHWAAPYFSEISTYGFETLSRTVDATRELCFYFIICVFAVLNCGTFSVASIAAE